MGLEGQKKSLSDQVMTTCRGGDAAHRSPSHSGSGRLAWKEGQQTSVVFAWEEGGDALYPPIPLVFLEEVMSEEEARVEAAHVAVSTSLMLAILLVPCFVILLRDAACKCVSYTNNGERKQETHLHR